MWKNLRSMPWLLWIITIHALACVGFLVGSVIETDSLYMNGRHVSLEELWGSGWGVITSIIGIVFPVSGVLMLKKNRHARTVYIGVLFFVSVVVPSFWVREIEHLVFDAFFVVMIAAYLYSNSVRSYFSSNKTMEPTR